MYFLVDYENVRDRGFDGMEYLKNTDTIVIFYSTACMTITKGIHDKIIETGCGLELIKLVQQGQNALDFYICSKVAQIFSENPNEKEVCIVSLDKGYEAAKDYWAMPMNGGKHVVKGKNIGNTILGSDSFSHEVKKQIIEKNKVYDLDDIRKKLVEKTMAKKMITDVLPEYDDETIEKCITLIQDKKTNKKMYTNCLKEFGWRTGIYIYSKIKPINIQAEANLDMLKVSTAISTEELSRLEYLLGNTADVDSLIQFIGIATSRHEINNWMQKRYKGDEFTRVQTIVKPFIAKIPG